MSGDNQHYLPASIIGRFGCRTGKQWRTARIVMRRVGSPDVMETAARHVAFEKELYRLSSPPAGLDADVVDQIWTKLEDRLPRAIQELMRGGLGAEQGSDVLFYVAACAARHPDVFVDVAGSRQGAAGLPPLTGDILQVARLQSVLDTLSQVNTWRWRVFDCSPDAESLILNDKGFCYLGDTSRPTSGLLLPLRPNLAIFGSLDDPIESHFSVRRTLTALSVRWVNHLLWLEAPREVYGHPAAIDAFRRLDRQPPINRSGPFMWRHGGGWFD